MDLTCTWLFQLADKQNTHYVLKYDWCVAVLTKKNVKKHKQERNKTGSVKDSIKCKSVIWLKIITGCMNLIAKHVNEGGMC